MDAEDLTGEVFLKAWQSLPKYKERGTLSGILVGSKNTLVDHYRQTTHGVKRSDDMDGYKAEWTREPVDTVGSNIERQNMLKLLNNLRADYQSVLILRFISELSPDETAKVMKRSVGAVRALPSPGFYHEKK
jgi:RNA polymerase sigma-70 factor (ECF subfamily)